jgi:hypothetical protein
VALSAGMPMETQIRLEFKHQLYQESYIVIDERSPLGACENDKRGEEKIKSGRERGLQPFIKQKKRTITSMWNCVVLWGVKTVSMSEQIERSDFVGTFQSSSKAVIEE